MLLLATVPSSWHVLNALLLLLQSLMLGPYVMVGVSHWGNMFLPPSPGAQPTSTSHEGPTGQQQQLQQQGGRRAHFRTEHIKLVHIAFQFASLCSVRAPELCVHLVGLHNSTRHEACLVTAIPTA